MLIIFLKKLIHTYIHFEFYAFLPYAVRYTFPSITPLENLFNGQWELTKGLTAGLAAENFSCLNSILSSRQAYNIA